MVIRRIFSRVAVLLVLSIGLSACGARVELMSGITEAEANELMAVLLSSGIDASKGRAKSGSSVSVPESDIGRSMQALSIAGLPRKRLATLGEVFKKDGLISTPVEERARYIHALSQELEHTLQQIDGVVTARVHVVLPERVSPGEPLQPSSAAVFIKHRPGFEGDLISPKVRHMVSSSIPGLSGAAREKVSVVMVESARALEPPAWRKVGPFQVAAQSEHALRIAFYALIGLLFACLLATLVTLAWRHPRGAMVRSLIELRFGLAKGRERGAA
jgi:type III secretion protein J